MYSILISLLMTISAPVFIPEAPGADSAHEVAAEKTDKIKIRSSVQCEQCRERVTRELSKLDGVKKVKIDLTNQTVTVQYDGAKVQPDQIRAALTAIGYDADDKPAQAEAYGKLPACCQKGGHH